MADDERATLLVVEDDAGVARLQQKWLERAGYHVLVTADAAEALAFVRRHPVDLLLLDQNLPGGVSGLELYQQVREAGFDMPAILVTAVTGDAIILQSFRAGLYDFVPKTPEYLDYLIPAIDRVLQKRHTERQLAASEARFAAVIASALDGVLTVDEEQRVGLFNPAAEQLFGCPAAEAVGQPIRRFLPDWSAPAVAAGGSATRWETEGVRRGGKRFPAEVSASWMEGPRRRFWTCMVRDFSERKRAQEQRERLIREQAARKEAEAAHRRMLVVAQENARLYHELRRSEQLKDEFLAMLAHELRNPLAPISNALSLIRLADFRRDVAEGNWAIIDRQASHLARLVDDLLDVSRINQGKITLQPEPVEVADVIARAVESSRALIDARSHTLDVRVPDKRLMLEGDPVRLVQVVANLLNNAAKYTPQRGHIELTAEEQRREREPHEWVKIRVRDSGVGIPAEMLPRLFEPFAQDERTLDRAEGGLGIGLTLVRRLTHLHGGEVQARSDGVGKGAEFTVLFPLSSAPLPPPEHRAAEPTGASPPARRVLVVDDSEDSAATLAQLLGTLGHEVAVAHDGEQALAAAYASRPEVLLLDIGLPGVDGYEVARRLRADPRFDAVVLAALTGYGSPEDRQLSQEAGFDAHLVKPVDLEALKQLLADPQALVTNRRPRPHPG